MTGSDTRYQSRVFACVGGGAGQTRGLLILVAFPANFKFVTIFSRGNMPVLHQITIHHTVLFTNFEWAMNSQTNAKTYRMGEQNWITARINTKHFLIFQQTINRWYSRRTLQLQMHFPSTFRHFGQKNLPELKSLRFKREIPQGFGSFGQKNLPELKPLRFKREIIQGFGSFGQKNLPELKPLRFKREIPQGFGSFDQNTRLNWSLYVLRGKSLKVSAVLTKILAWIEVSTF